MKDIEKGKEDYIKDLAEIRSIMERSSKFLSLSGLSGVMAGIYALAGAYIAFYYLGFNPERIIDAAANANLTGVFFLAMVILFFALGTAILFSYKSAYGKGESIWNPAAKQLLINMAVPLAAGGILMLILWSKEMVGLLAPVSLLFYGIALFNASKFSIEELKFLGIIQIFLGLLGALFIEYSIIIWAAGFGLFHIVYGIYMYFRYER
jgi:hypothetical protein